MALNSFLFIVNVTMLLGLVLVLTVVAVMFIDFCRSNSTAVILTIATLVLVMLLVKWPPSDFMCKARRVGWVWESRCHLVSVQIILVLRGHKKEHQLLAYSSAPSKIK